MRTRCAGFYVQTKVKAQQSTEIAKCHLSSDTIFACIFRPFSTQLHFTFLTPHLSPSMIISLMLLCLSHTHKQTTRTQFDWYDQTPNNSTTGLPTFQNSPAVILPHPDPAREPLLPPPNAPTTQSSGLPKLRARVGVRPSREYSW